jgi:hypothetical protein
MSRDVSDPKNYRIIRREDGSGKYEVQFRIDDGTWSVAREVRSVNEGNRVIEELREQERK